jgi:peptidoglycan/LPS O-acetylase OafA/YrhL
VYPLHFFTLWWVVAAGALILARPCGQWDTFFHLVFDPRAVPASLVLLQAMHLFSTAPLNTVSWSLSTEWWMYLLFPLLTPALMRSGRWQRWGWLPAVAGGYALVKYWLVPQWGMHLGQRQPATLNTINDFAFPRCMAGFVLGMLGCRWYQAGAGRSWLKKDVAFLVIGTALGLSLHFDANELAIVALFPLLILSAAYNESFVWRLLGMRPAQRLGDWSFSIYMVHMPLFFTYRGLAPLVGWPVFDGLFTAHPDYRVGWLAFGVWLTVTLVVAAGMYRWVEVPARNYLNRRRVMPVLGS